MSFFKVCAIILFYFVSRMVFTFGDNGFAATQDKVVCLNQVDKTGGPICLADSE